MADPILYLTFALTAFSAIGIVSLVGLKGFTGWLDLKRAELEVMRAPETGTSPSATSRIEIADLKERLRKLEAIAAGVDL